MYTLGSEFNAFLFLFSFHFMRGVPVLRIYRFTFSVQLCIVQTITESYYHKNSVQLCNVFQYNLKYPSLSPICNTLDKIKKTLFCPDSSSYDLQLISPVILIIVRLHYLHLSNIAPSTMIQSLIQDISSRKQNES